MNRAYLDSLPEVRNKYGFQLKDDEKVVFTCKLAVSERRRARCSAATTPFSR